MLKSKAATYAILAATEVARRQLDVGAEGQRGVRASEIADILHLPAAYTAKILTQLTRAQLLESGRGPRGGFSLAREPRAVNLLEIAEAVERLVPSEAADDAGTPELRRCVDNIFEGAMSRARDFLRSMTLADILERVPAMMSTASVH